MVETLGYICGLLYDHLFDMLNFNLVNKVNMVNYVSLDNVHK